MIINFDEKKTQRQEIEKEATEFISYVRKNCTQSPEMLAFLDQPILKKEMVKILSESKTILKLINEEKD